MTTPDPICHVDELYRYLAWGLTIDSDLSLPELPEREHPDLSQIRIRRGHVAGELEGRAAKGGLFEVSPGRFLLRLDGVARYLVSDGVEITIDVDPGADQASVRLFLLGPVFGALLHQRGLLPLHASAIETSKGAVVFAGVSGFGKSALAGAFNGRGYRVLADEICVVDCASTASIVQPAFPRLLLWPDVIGQLGLWGENVRPARANLKKCHVPLGNGFANHPLPLHAIYIPRVTNAGDFDLSRVDGTEKVRKLIDLTFRRQYLSGMASGHVYFDQVTAVARGVSISRFGRPSGRSLQESADLLERDFAR